MIVKFAREQTFRPVLGCLAALLAFPAMAQAMPLAAHRAVYDMQLDNASQGAGVADMRGRLVFEFVGSACTGYAMNMRFVTRVADREGKVAVTDMRTSSWEGGKGEKFRFNSTQYIDQRLSEATRGVAKRADGARIAVALEEPAAKTLTMGPDVTFPTEHLIALIEAGQKGQRVLQRRVYDGSETGEKVYDTTAIIGAPVTPRDPKSVAKKAKELSGLGAWPVSIAYFDGSGDQAGEEVPSYQISFDLFENGVSDRLTLDYGNIVLKGHMSSIEFIPEPSCE